ncbi:hypothetical protein ICHIAU1_16050 [Fluviibacter phosphoraccumulans]|uniref:Uncharacterized protein n=1 Tax=Fluviibacter phosphoraccumulans TaxID=1751046 RepID=A0A679HWR5_9RHOO|nr:hypothetical protein ICHIAU1_16050 [Fluviibacter phosphoraccumulans]BCA65257.1 hypothetical protein SHINM1_008590 [Fluviibacter phosphoraccumulans]
MRIATLESGAFYEHSGQDSNPYLLAHETISALGIDLLLSEQFQLAQRVCLLHQVQSYLNSNTFVVTSKLLIAKSMLSFRTNFKPTVQCVFV